MLDTHDDGRGQASFDDHALRRAAIDLTTRFRRPGESRWDDSAWGWMRHLPPKAKALAGRELLRAWLKERGVGTYNLVGHAVGITLPNGHAALIKTSMLWWNDGGAGNYHFQQIRDGTYSQLLMFGLSPQLAHLWVVPRKIALAKSAPLQAEESRVLIVDPLAVPDWLRPYGGSLARGATVLLQATSTNYPEEA